MTASKKVQEALPFAIAAVTFLAFFPVLRAHFADLDDTNIIVNNLYFRGLAWSNLRWMFTQSLYIGVYIPLSWMTLALDYLVWGMNPFGYHLTNLILHCFNAVLCYFLARRMFLAACVKNEVWPTVLSALFFALHPLRVESVAWISERRDVLSGFFFFLTLLAYCRYAIQERRADQRTWYAVTIVLYGLLLLAKAVGITMPVLLLILDAYPLKRLTSSSSEKEGRRLSRVWLEKIPFLVIGMVFTVVAAQAQMKAGAAWRLADLSLLERVGIVSYGMIFYIRKTLWPFHLYPLHELFLPIRLSSPPFLISLLSLLAISFLLFWKRRSWPALWTSWMAYVVILSPFSGVFQSGPQLVADRYSYLSCLAWAFLFGYFFRRRPATAVVLLIFLGVLTQRQCRVWRDGESVYRQIVEEDSRSVIARAELGHILISRGDFSEGARYLTEAFELKPTAPVAYNLAIACEKLSRWDDAARLYSFVIQKDPNFLQAYNNLGLLYRKMGQREDAIFCFREALKRSDAAELHFNLGLVYQDEKKGQEASQEYSRAVALRPDFAGAVQALEK